MLMERLESSGRSCSAEQERKLRYTQEEQKSKVTVILCGAVLLKPTKDHARPRFSLVY